jgi:hypothetical protein
MKINELEFTKYFGNYFTGLGESTEQVTDRILELVNTMSDTEIEETLNGNETVFDSCVKHTISPSHRRGCSICRTNQ